MPNPGWHQLRRLRGHERLITQFEWSPDGAQLATVGQDGRFVIWNARSGKPVVVRDLRRPVAALAWAPESDVVAVVVFDDRSASQLLDIDDFGYADEELEDEDELLARFERGDFGPLQIEAQDEGLAYVWLLDAESGLSLGNLATPSLRSAPADITWLDNSHVVTASHEGLCQWQARDGHFLGFVEDGDDGLTAVAVQPEQRLIAACGTGSVGVWEAAGQLRYSLEVDDFKCIAFAPDRMFLAAGGRHGQVEVWDPALEPLRTLEGHTGTVTSVSFSADGNVLASAATDGSVKLWETHGWTLLGEITSHSMISVPGFVRFGPAGELAVLAGRGNSVRVLQLDMPVLASKHQVPRTVQYASAKVVLLGDSGVGKTGLGLVLSGHNFRATESTHRRNIWLLSTESTEGDVPQRRETFLWDLPGQPGYRLLHQLHLGDTAVAVVVFDARTELDPLGGVRHWARALGQAERQTGSSLRAITRILVAARMDRGGAAVNDDELREVRRTFGFVRYVATSAKQSDGIATLRQEIADAIDWPSVPTVSSNSLFDAIRGFLLQKKETDLALCTEAELRHAFAATGALVAEEVESEFRTCIDRAQANGLVRRLSFGDLVLLRPEMLDAYAAAVLNAADDLGAISEHSVRDAAFPMPADERLSDPQAERLLLIATVEDLLHHEVGLREDSGEGPYLVFPTRTTRSFRPAVALIPWCSFMFEGPVQHVWATLVVRLAHSGVFVSEGVGHSLATFGSMGRVFGLQLELLDEGQGRVYCSREKAVAPSDVDELFERFVWSHLRRRARRDTVSESRAVVCPECEFVVPVDFVSALGDAVTMNCPRCPGTIQLAPSGVPVEKRTRSAIRVLQQNADDERTRLAARTTVVGKEAVHEFDVFLAHNSRDRDAVGTVAERLRDAGLNPWLDQEQIPPGQWFQAVLQDAVLRVASAAILIGTAGLGRWEALELRVFISQCVERGIPVIPVLLPGAVLPPEAPFLRELQYVEFRRDVEEAEPFARLAWGITQDRELYARLTQGEV